MDKKFNAEESRSGFLLSRENGIGIQYVADMKDQFETSLPHVRVSMKTLPYLLNQRQLKIESLSEQMRLLYVAMTRAEKKLYLVGKGKAERLLEPTPDLQRDGLLLASQREQMTSFQDWVLGIYRVFTNQELFFTVQVVTDSDLTAEQIGRLNVKTPVPIEDLVDNRQSMQIEQALEQLESVEKINQSYRAAIDLPSVRTPSQVKKIYEPIVLEDGLDIMQKKRVQASFELPSFGEERQVTGAQVGSAVHQLMQAIPLGESVTERIVESILDAMKVSPELRQRISIDKVVAFFKTNLGREIIAAKHHVYREATFAALQTDPVSREQFVLRGIVDGFILYDDRITLFDYKTDYYTDSRWLVDRYRGQMNLYAQALRQVYRVEHVDSYLILLGGADIEVVRI